MTVKRADGQPNPTNQLPIHFDILVDEPVVDFPTGPNVHGLSLTGTATGLRYTVEGEKEHYRLTILEVGGDGSIDVAVPEGLCADLFGNVNYRSTGDDASVLFDGTRPSCLVHSDQAGVVNSDTMTIALSFSEPVFGLDDSVLSVLDNASVVRASGADGDSEYVFQVTPLRDGILALQVPEDAVIDGVGNGNKASQVFSLIVDSTGPSVTLTSFETPIESNSRFIRVRAAFSEPVVGFEKEDVAVESGTLVNFSQKDEDGRVFVFDVRPNRAPVTLHIPEGVATDKIGNPNRKSEVFHRDYDPDRPEVTIVVEDSGRFRGDPVPVEVQFTEPVFGVDPDTLKVTGGTASLISGGEGVASYVFEVRASGRGAVRLSVAAGSVRDAAGNGNKSASARFSLKERPASEVEPGAAAPPLNLK